MRKRIEETLRKIEKENVDGLLVIKNEALIKENVRYVSGFSGSSAYIIISPEHRILITDDRYTEQAVEECPNFEIVRHGRPFTKIFNEVVNNLNIKKLGFERNGVTVDLFNTLKENLTGIELVSTKGIIEGLRAVKDEKELVLMKKAAQITDRTFEHILDFIKMGIKERDIALEMEFYMRKIGASDLAFDLILVSGKRSSHQHGAPSEKKIEHGDFVTMDFGALYKSYRCDMTRTIVVGNADEKQKEVYNTVKMAQQEGVNILKAEVEGKKVSAYVRKIIEKAGYGDYSGHGLGHGVGLEIHEVPYIRAYGDFVLKAGNVVTVEPGIYIPGWGGVRIEDTIIIKEEGCEIITKSPKDLIAL